MKPMKERIVTSDNLNAALRYDKDTGLLIWKKSHQKVKIDDIAGHHRRDGYIDIAVYNHLFLAHRVIWCMVEGYWPEFEIDHLNRIRNDNRWVNLAHKTQSCNTRNGSLRIDNSTGIKGVHKIKNKGKYVARITVDGDRKFLGEFWTIEEAARARLLAEEKYGYTKCLHGHSTAKEYLLGRVQ